MESRLDTSIPGSRGRAVSGKLFNLLSPKPKVSSPPTISLPSRIPVRRKRDHHEIASDENENRSSADSREARIRQRLTSSARRPDTQPEPRARTDSMRSVATIKAGSSAKAKKTPSVCPVTSQVVAERASTAARTTSTVTALKQTTSHNKPREKKDKRRESKTSITPVPSKDGVPVKPRATIKSTSTRRQKSPISRRSTGLRRIESFRSFKETDSTSDDDDDVFADFDYAADEVTVPVRDVNDHDEFEQFRRRRESDRLSLEDEVVVRKVVTSVVDDPEVVAENLRYSEVSVPSRRHIVTDELDDIPGFVHREVEADMPRRSLGTSTPPLTGARANLERFDVSIKARSKHTTMWDVSLDDTYAWPGILYVTDSRPFTGILPRIPIQSIEIEWSTVEHRDDADPEYSASYTGQALNGCEVVSRMDPTQGICTEPLWSHLPSDVTSSPGGAWALRFWVPVPMNLFKGRECRAFRVRAKVTFGDWDLPRFTMHSGAVDVSIEHLRGEREMGVKLRSA